MDARGCEPRPRRWLSTTAALATVARAILAKRAPTGQSSGLRRTSFTVRICRIHETVHRGHVGVPAGADPGAEGRRNAEIERLEFCAALTMVVRMAVVTGIVASVVAGLILLWIQGKTGPPAIKGASAALGRRVPRVAAGN